MKKLFFLICLLIGIGNINAATITNSKYEDGQISLSGTGTKQVQIVLFDKDNKPIYMATTDASSGEFNFTLPKIANLAEGKYTIKAADYDGSAVATKEITVKNEVTEKEVVKNPDTNDNIVLYMATSAVSLIGIFGIMSVIKKKNLIKN